MSAYLLSSSIEVLGPPLAVVAAMMGDGMQFEGEDGDKEGRERTGGRLMTVARWMRKVEVKAACGSFLLDDAVASLTTNAWVQEYAVRAGEVETYEGCVEADGHTHGWDIQYA